MSKRNKRLIIIIAAAVLCAATALCAVLMLGRKTTAEMAARYVADNAKPEFGNEWAAVALAGGESSVAEDWLKDYAFSLKTKLQATDGVIAEADNYNVYSRTAIACAEMGYDPSNVFGYDLTRCLLDVDAVTARGINSMIFALIALDKARSQQETAQVYVDALLLRQQESGAFGLNMNVPDADITAMCLQALAEHMDRADVKAAAQRAVSALANMQAPSGGFCSMGKENSQSLSQVIMALDALNISLTDSRFVKGESTLLTALMAYKTEDGGFLRLKTDEKASLAATVQALQALNRISKTKEPNKN